MSQIRILIVILLFFQYFSLNAQKADVKIIEVPELLMLTTEENSKPRVINFWATWCKPCVKELPYFLEYASLYPEVEFIFVSLDFADQIEKVKTFASKKGLDKHSLYLIDDLDYNAWIDKVSPRWSGAIPATLLINSKGKLLIEGAVEEKQLKSLLSSTFK